MSLFITKTKLINDEVCQQIKNIINPKLKLEIINFDCQPQLSGYQEIINSVNNMTEQIKKEHQVKDTDFIISINHGIGSFINKIKKQEDSIKNKLINKRKKETETENETVSQQNFILLFYISITKSVNTNGTFSTSIPLKIDSIRKSIKEKIDILDTFESIDNFSGIPTNELILFTFNLLIKNI